MDKWAVAGRRRDLQPAHGGIIVWHTVTAHGHSARSAHVAGQGDPRSKKGGSGTAIGEVSQTPLGTLARGVLHSQGAHEPLALGCTEEQLAGVAERAGYWVPYVRAAGLGKEGSGDFSLLFKRIRNFRGPILSSSTGK